MAATYGQITTIGASALQMVTAATPVFSGTQVKALAANSGKVYMGLTSSVTTTSGWELSAGNELFISRAEAPDASGIYVIASATSQGVCYRAV